MNELSDTQARLGFDLGTSSVDLYFDNITLSKGEIPTAIEFVNPAFPNSFQLYQNYPNPFNPATIISYSIPINGNVSLKIYDILGREVAILLDENKMRGAYTLEFKPSGFVSGVYFYRIKAGSFIDTKKMMLIE
jgi:hypothetical protein